MHKKPHQALSRIDPSRSRYESLSGPREPCYAVWIPRNLLDICEITLTRRSRSHPQGNLKRIFSSFKGFANVLVLTTWKRVVGKITNHAQSFFYKLPRCSFLWFF